MHIDIEEHYDKVYRYCYFKLHNQHKAEDITQETFLRCLESDSYREAGRPLAYLYTIARNLCIDEFRREQTKVAEVEIREDGFEDRMIDAIDLEAAMKQLSESEQELLLLRCVNEVPYAVLEKLYGQSRFALRRSIKKIVQKLERSISNET